MLDDIRLDYHTRKGGLGPFPDPLPTDRGEEEVLFICNHHLSMIYPGVTFVLSTVYTLGEDQSQGRSRDRGRDMDQSEV